MRRSSRPDGAILSLPALSISVLRSHSGDSPVLDFSCVVKVAPGVRLSVSPRGIGLSGPSWKSLLPHAPAPRRPKGRSRPSPAPRAAVPAPKPETPGVFAPRGEKALFKALTARDPEWMAHVGRTDPVYRAVAYGYAGVMLTADDPAAARGLLVHALAEGGDPGAHPFVGKYGPGVKVGIAPGVEARLPFGRDALGLALAELHQAAGDVGGAIEVVEQLEPTTYAGVSLAELYGEAGRHQDVVNLTNGLRNEDGTTALLLVYRGAALRELGFHEASREAFKEALKSKARDQDIRRHLALSERARTYEAENKKAMARKDLERILAENAGYEGVRERLAELA